MYKESDKQTGFFGDTIYDRIIPKDHFLRRLAEAVDFSFVNDMCKDLYCKDNGRPCWEPQLVFKMLLIQYLYNLSDARIEEEVKDRLSFKWFLGIEADAMPPDATTLVKFRDRLGAELFAKAFNNIVAQARNKNLVSDKLHIVDATAIKAKVDLLRLRQKCKQEKPDSDISKDDINKKTPDKDARFGHTSPTKTVYGYKGYVQMDKDSEIIVSSTVDSANEQESNHLKELIEQTEQPGTILADKAYDTPQNDTMLKDKQIESGIIHKKISKDKVSGCFSSGSTQSPEEVSKFTKIRQSIEHKISELKRWHKLRNSRYLGLLKNKIQMFLTCIAVNVKRIVKLITAGTSPPLKMSVFISKR